MQDLNRVQKYLRKSEEYFNNAEKAKRNGEFMKASELLWGAVTQSIKALAAKTDKEIRTHTAFFDFTHGISKELKDKEFHELFLFLNSLHRNFYDECIRPQDFQMYLAKTALFVKKVEEALK